MIEWTRTTRYVLCGGCGAQLAPGDPIQRIVVSSYGGRRGSKAHVRGTCCAGDAPPSLPSRLRLRDALPDDWQRVAANDREPGEDG